MWFDFSFGLGALVIVVILVAASIKILREYERAVVFLLGRFQAVKGPGLIIIIPVIQQMVRVDLRTVVLDVPPQDVITRDNVSVKVNAVVYFRVVDAQHAIIQVVNFLEATSQLAQTTLRAVLGKHELDELLSEREKLNLDIQAILDSQTNAFPTPSDLMGQRLAKRGPGSGAGRERGGTARHLMCRPAHKTRHPRRSPSQPRAAFGRRARAACRRRRRARLRGIDEAPQPCTVPHFARHSPRRRRCRGGTAGRLPARFPCDRSISRRIKAFHLAGADRRERGADAAEEAPPQRRGGASARR